MNTLLEWKAVQSKEHGDSFQSRLNRISATAHEVKSLQKNLASSITNIQTQYYELVRAQFENPEIRREPDVYEGLCSLQES